MVGTQGSGKANDRVTRCFSQLKTKTNLLQCQLSVLSGHLVGAQNVMKASVVSVMELHNKNRYSFLLVSPNPKE